MLIHADDIRTLEAYVDHTLVDEELGVDTICIIQFEQSLHDVAV